MSGTPSRYGRRLSAEEYDERAVRIHDRAFADLPSASPEDLDRRLRRLAFDLAIDRRIGVDFPRDAREKLIGVRERVDEERRSLTGRMLRREISREEFAEGLQKAVEVLVADLRAELSPDEVKDLLGVPTLAAAALPLDPKRIRLPGDP